MSNFRGVGKWKTGSSQKEFPMARKEKDNRSPYQGLINQLLISHRLISIQEICLLWVFKSKENLNAKQVEQLQIIANKPNIFPAIKSNKLTFFGGANHG